MKLLLLTVACMFVASALPHNEWAKYKAKYGKVYTSEREDLERYNEYLKTKKMIEEHNIRFKKGETTYWMGINHFSDWFPEEINRMLGTKLDLSSTDSQGKPFELPEGTPAPDSINWVKKGAVTKVKNQGKCGSCYAFSSVGSLEGLMFTTNNTITDLSAQELVDCAFSLGCDGGNPFFCFSYVANRKGIDTDASYPYKAKETECKADKGVIGSSCTGFQLIMYEENLKKAVGAVGPVSIYFAVDNSFIHYKGGIFDGSCAQNPNHAMVAVGYDKDNKTGKDYWLIKNSWGTGWGEKGYARVPRNVNKCDIGAFSLLPVDFP